METADERRKRVFRDNLKAFMKARQMNAIKLAALSGVSLGSIQKYVREDKPGAKPMPNPGYDKVLALADALQCDAADFSKEEPPPLRAFVPKGLDLQVLADDVPEELQKRARDVIEEINRAYADLKRGRPARPSEEIGAQPIPGSHLGQTRGRPQSDLVAQKREQARASTQTNSRRKQKPPR